MTSRPPVTLSITGGKRATIKPVAVQEVPAEPANTPKPATRFGERAEARAELGATYAAILGVEVMARDILEAMMSAETTGDQPQPQALADGLAGRGVAIDPAPGDAALKIDCRGLAARDAMADLRGVKGEMLILRAPDVAISRVVRLLHPRIPLYVVPRGGGVYMIGATMIESAERGRITARSLLEMLSSVYALHPAFGEAEVLETGVDARPAYPDNLPRIRRRGDTIYVNGLYRHGFLLAPAMARIPSRAATSTSASASTRWARSPTASRSTAPSCRIRAPS